MFLFDGEEEKPGGSLKKIARTILPGKSTIKYTGRIMAGRRVNIVPMGFLPSLYIAFYTHQLLLFILFT